MEFMDKFDAEALLRRLKTGNFSGVFMVPTQFHQVFSLDQKILDACHGMQIRTIISNAAPLPQAMKHKIVASLEQFKSYPSPDHSHALLVSIAEHLTAEQPDLPVASVRSETARRATDRHLKIEASISQARVPTWTCHP